MGNFIGQKLGKVIGQSESGAEEEFERALELDPNSARAHSEYAWYLKLMGRPRGALEEARRAQKLDPVSFQMNLFLGARLSSSRFDHEAERQYLATLELEPDSARAHWHLGNHYLHSGQYEKAVVSLQQAMTLGNVSEVLADLARAYALWGKKDESDRYLERLIEDSKRDYVNPAFEMAPLYAARGEMNEAFRWLEKGYRERADNLPLVATDRRFDPLRGDPRYERFLRKLDLPLEAIPRHLSVK